MTAFAVYELASLILSRRSIIRDLIHFLSVRLRVHGRTSSGDFSGRRLLTQSATGGQAAEDQPACDQLAAEGSGSRAEISASDSRAVVPGGDHASGQGYCEAARTLLTELRPRFVPLRALREGRLLLCLLSLPRRSLPSAATGRLSRGRSRAIYTWHFSFSRCPSSLLGGAATPAIRLRLSSNVKRATFGSKKALTGQCPALEPSAFTAQDGFQRFHGLRC